MRQGPFTKRYTPDWAALENALESDDKAGKRRREKVLADLPRHYRNICHQLALARSRAYSYQLIDRLQRLVMRSHQRLYSIRPPLGRLVWRFLLIEYPRLVRSEWRFMLLSAALFFGPLLAMLIAIQWQPEMAFTVIDPVDARSYEAMYSPELQDRLGREREADSDFLMFGFYVKNNTGIGFQTFAGGLTFGLLTVFFLLFNGLLIGAVAGHLTAAGYGETFWTFAVGHSAPELIAIMLTGAAGLKLGMALFIPGRQTRMAALRNASRIGVRLVYGAVLLFFFAAFVEAFWSSIAGMQPAIKYAAGAFLWVIILSWLLLLGRHEERIADKAGNG